MERNIILLTNKEFDEFVLNKSNIEDSKILKFEKINEKYYIVKYIKNMLCDDLIESYGLFRSVVFDISGNRIVCFSPPKSIKSEKFIEKYSNISDSSINIEPFIEGTMINLFWTGDKWEISTRNGIGGNYSYFKGENNKKTFKEMFDDCISSSVIEKHFNKSYCYSFVLQHPQNRIVILNKKPQLHLVDIYECSKTNEINSVKVVYEEKERIMELKLPNIYCIKKIENKYNSYSDLIDDYASMNTSYQIMGVIVKNTVSGERCKFRNPAYEEMKQLRGNEPKMQYKYLSLRKEGKVEKFLAAFPEYKKEFSKYRDQVHLYTNTLYENYISCYIMKNKPLLEYPEQYRKNMFNIHQYYLKTLRDEKMYVNISVVIDYVNKLHPAQLMFFLNYNFRKNIVEDKKKMLDNK